MPNICSKCVRNAQYKKLISIANHTGDCGICGESDYVIDYENSDFIDLSKALVRFNFSEWDYNHHLGGDGYESLFYGEGNIFFNEDRALSEEIYDELVLSITESEVYEDYDKGISIFAGYHGQGFQNPPLEAIKDTFDSRLLIILDRLKNENYFSLEKEVIEIIDDFTPVSEKKMEPDIEFFRSRIGLKDTKVFYDFSPTVGYHYMPYVNDEIAAPPPHLVGSGRVNRPGVSFFYCASDQYTAISEVRPHPGDRLSIGKFKLKKSAQIFDLTESQLLHFSSSDKELDRYKGFNTLGAFMHKTVTPSDQSHYSITQLIADCVRQLGYDGIEFKSTVGTGHNFVFFDPGILEYIDEDADAIEVRSVTYVYDSLPLVQDAEIYLEKSNK